MFPAEVTVPAIPDPPRRLNGGEPFDSTQHTAGSGIVAVVRNQQDLDALDIDSLPDGSVIQLASHQPYDFKNRDTSGLQVRMADFSTAPPPAFTPASSSRKRLPPQAQPITAQPRQSPNAPCGCGSGKKFKKCCR
jgi:hypothetical protein